MKRMLTAEQIKKAENNCGTLFSSQNVPANEIPHLFVPFTKEAKYYSSSKKLELDIAIDFTDCIPGCKYELDWYNTPYDAQLKQMYPGVETWAEAINLWRDINVVELDVDIYGLKSGIEFEMPANLFVIEKNTLRGGANITLSTKDEDKVAYAPINIQYNELEDKTSLTVFTSPIRGNWPSNTTDVPHNLIYRLKAVGPVVDSAWGW